MGGGSGASPGTGGTLEGSGGGGALGTGGGVASTGGAPAGSGGATATGGGGGSPPPTACLDFSDPQAVGTVQTTALYELSGLAASRAHPGVLYGHADAGSPARFFAFEISGRILGEFMLSGALSTDWEDIAIGRGPGGGGDYLYIGDIGDNAAREGSGIPRSEIRVYRVEEPAVALGQAPGLHTIARVDTLQFTYPDRPHDAETLMLDPVSGDLVIVTKENDGNSAVFRAPASLASGTSTVLEKIANVQFGVAGTDSARLTAGDIAPNGDRIVMRTNTNVLLWARVAGPTLAASLTATFAAAPRVLVHPNQPQGEAIAFAWDGRSWFAAGEQQSTIFQATAVCP